MFTILHFSFEFSMIYSCRSLSVSSCIFCSLCSLCPATLSHCRSTYRNPSTALPSGTTFPFFSYRKFAPCCTRI